MKKIDFNTTQKKMLDAIKEREVHYGIICDVASIMEQFEGKEITKRIMTVIKKALPQYTYYWDDQRTYSRSIQMWGNGLAFDDHITIYLPYSFGIEGHIYNHTAFIETNQCHFLDAERNKRAIEQAPLLEDAVTHYNKLIQELKEIQSHFTESPLDCLFIRGEQ